MGTLLELYRCADAPAALALAAERYRAWETADWATYNRLAELCPTPGTPPNCEEVVFESTTGDTPTCHKLGSLLVFMAERDLPPLWEVFGFATVEPKPPAHYRVPDWTRALDQIRACRAALSTARANPIPLRDVDTITPDHAHFDKHAHLQHQLDSSRENVERHRALLQAFEEMIAWVLAQPEPSHYLVCWSW